MVQLEAFPNANDRKREPALYLHTCRIDNDHLLVCVRTACAHLINTDFLVLRHVLNLIRRTKYRTFSMHC